MRILITGGSGQVGNALRQVFNDFTLLTPTRAELDLSTKDFSIDGYRPELVINTAAYTAVDKAESDKDAALACNATGVAILAKQCHKANIPLIHLSTDYVFAGNAKTPYGETAPTGPINYYGQTKYLGEQAIIKSQARHCIIRVSSIFSDTGHNFVKTIGRLLLQDKELKVVNDQWICPTSALHIARVLKRIVPILLTTECYDGLYHYSDQTLTTWYDFACQIALALNRDPSQVSPCSTKEYPTAARRPNYSVLDSSKLCEIFKLSQYRWRDGLNDVISRLFTDNTTPM